LFEVKTRPRPGFFFLYENNYLFKNDTPDSKFVIPGLTRDPVSGENV